MIEPASDWRAARKARTKQQIQDAAVRLFLEQGFDNVTVEEIAAAAGVSHMTVFRHFGTKEQIVLSDEYDPLIVAKIQHRPPDEPVLDSIETAMLDLFDQLGGNETELLMRRTRLIMATPELQDNFWANWLMKQKMLAEALAGRGGEARDPMTWRVLAGLGIVTVATAAMTWYEEGGRRSLADLVREAFAAARGETTAMPERNREAT